MRFFVVPPASTEEVETVPSSEGGPRFEVWLEVKDVREVGSCRLATELVPQEAIAMGFSGDIGRGDRVTSLQHGINLSGLSFLRCSARLVLVERLVDGNGSCGIKKTRRSNVIIRSERETMHSTRNFTFSVPTAKEIVSKDCAQLFELLVVWRHGTEYGLETLNANRESSSLVPQLVKKPCDGVVDS